MKPWSVTNNSHPPHSSIFDQCFQDGSEWVMYGTLPQLHQPGFIHCSNHTLLYDIFKQSSLMNHPVDSAQPDEPFSGLCGHGLKHGLARLLRKLQAVIMGILMGI